MILSIDSTDNTKTIIEIDEERFEKDIATPREQDVFGFMMKCIEDTGHKIQDVTAVKVNQGPGSFTGTRVGVAIANAIGFALKVDVNGMKPPVIPEYSSPPSITMPKKP